MAALSDATLAAIARLSVGTPVEDETDFTAMTPAEVAAKYELASYGGDEGSYVYALGSDGDYDALDPDLPPVNDLGLWAVGAFVNRAANGMLAGAVAGSPGTMPNLWQFDSAGGATLESVVVGTYKGLPALTVAADVPNSLRHYLPNQYTAGEVPGDVLNFSCFGAAVTTGTFAANNPYSSLLTRSNWAGVKKVLDGTEDFEHVLLGPYTALAGIIGGLYVAAGGFVTASGAGTVTCYAAGPQYLVNVGYNPPVLALSSAATTTHLAAITQREVAVWKPFVVVVRATTKEDPGASQVFYSLSRNADELIEIYRATGTDQITLHIRSGGVDYTDALGSVADNTAFSVAFNVFAAFTAASLDGGTVQVLTARKPSGVLTLESIGCKHDGTLQCNGPVAECTLIHPAVWTAEQLEAA